MAYDTQKYSGSWTLSIIQNSKNYKTIYWKLDLFPSSREGRTLTSVGVFLPSHETKEIQFLKRFLVLGLRADGQSPEPQ
jgi:hypothetical protein